MGDSRVHPDSLWGEILFKIATDRLKLTNIDKKLLKFVRIYIPIPGDLRSWHWVGMSLGHCCLLNTEI